MRQYFSRKKIKIQKMCHLKYLFQKTSNKIILCVTNGSIVTISNIFIFSSDVMHISPPIKKKKKKFPALNLALTLSRKPRRLYSDKSNLSPSFFPSLIDLFLRGN